MTKPRNAAYTGLLGMSLIAILTACALLYVDASQHVQIREPLAILIGR